MRGQPEVGAPSFALFAKGGMNRWSILGVRRLDQVRKAVRSSDHPTLRKKREGWGTPLISGAGTLKTGTLEAGRAGVVLVLLLLAAGCEEKSTSKPLSQLTPQEAAGQQVFARQCAGCHYPNTEQGLAGPGLEKLFRKPYLSSGAPANDDRVTSVILRGRGMMPAMGNALTDQDLQDLLAYLHTL